MTHTGLHHVTAICGPARKNFDFYTGLLGLRFIKKTVNFDDPGTYHLYYGDEVGHPGSVLTFFPWESASAGRLGIGEAARTSFRVPRDSMAFWTRRLSDAAVPHAAPLALFGETVLPFTDPDGMALALVGLDDISGEPAWSNGEIPREHAIRGFHGVTLLLRAAEATAAILRDVLGFSEIARDGDSVRFQAGEGGFGRFVDLRTTQDGRPGQQGGGSVHHVAFRAADDAAQAAMVDRLATAHGIRATEQKDRNYFRSVYFREPGGVLFEIATDIPGFSVDEPVESLGRALKLPPALEPHRARIESVLAPLPL